MLMTPLILYVIDCPSNMYKHRSFDLRDETKAGGRHVCVSLSADFLTSGRPITVADIPLWSTVTSLFLHTRFVTRCLGDNLPPERTRINIFFCVALKTLRCFNFEFLSGMFLLRRLSSLWWGHGNLR